MVDELLDNLDDLINSFKDDKNFDALYKQGVKKAEKKTINYYEQLIYGVQYYLEKTNQLCPFYKSMRKENMFFHYTDYDHHCINCLGADKTCMYYNAFMKVIKEHKEEQKNE